jgi:translation elongation factor EF-Ts
MSPCTSLPPSRKPLIRLMLPPAVMAREREIAEAKAAESGKPANIVEKMVEGAVKKYLSEVSLVEQAFVKDPDTKVGALRGQGRCQGRQVRAFGSG